jgi:uncharacterized repeat protein (TIGR02543 family)
MKLYAVWKNYSEIKLVGADELYFEEGYALSHEDSRKDNPFCVKHIYEFEPEYLVAPTKEGYTFFGWFDNPEFSGEPVSRLARYEDNVGTYYACFMKESYKVQIEYKDYNHKIRRQSLYMLPDETLRYKLDFSQLDISTQFIVTGVYDSEKLVIDENGYWLLDDEPRQMVSHYYRVESYKAQLEAKLHYFNSNDAKYYFITVNLRLTKIENGEFRYVLLDLPKELPGGLTVEGVYFDIQTEELAFDENGVSVNMLTVSEFYIKVK